MKSPITKIRSAGFTKINQLVRAAAHVKELKPGFAEWNSGEIYVCKKTGTYRYRFGNLGKSVTPWSATAERLFSSPAAFAFAAMVLAPESRESITQPLSLSAPSQARADVIALANAA
jgi:hypothetical protein